MLRFLFSVVAATLLLSACSQTPPPPPPAPPAQRAMAPSQMPRATVYFATGSSTLSPELIATIQQVAANYKTTANATVTLIRPHRHRGFTKRQHGAVAASR